VDVYRSSPPLPGIYRPFHLLPSTHLPPKPNPEDSLVMKDYIDSSDSEFGCAKAGGSTGDEEEGARSPSPGEKVGADILKAPSSATRKHRASSQPEDAG
jgi:hypothetical protein